MSTIAVVGGGIAGLTPPTGCVPSTMSSSSNAKRRPAERFRSQKIDGFLFEWGPSGFSRALTSCRRSSESSACAMR